MRGSGDLAYIHRALRGLAVPLGELQADRAGARRHNARNLAALRGSLAQFGQRRPAVVQREGMIVRAGCGMLEAARQLGWTHLAAIFVDEDDVSAASYGIADNRAAELAGWNRRALKRAIHAVAVGEADLQEMFAELAVDTGILGAELTPPPRKQRTKAADDDTFEVLISCAAEAEQVELLDELNRRGYLCRAPIS